MCLKLVEIRKLRHLCSDKETDINLRANRKHVFIMRIGWYNFSDNGGHK